MIKIQFNLIGGILSICLIMILQSCGKDEYVYKPYSPTIKKIEGDVLNKIDGTPIRKVLVNLYSYEWWSGDLGSLNQFTKTNDSGYFQFSNVPDVDFGENRNVRVKDFEDEYQARVWVNGEKHSFINSAPVILNSDGPQQIQFELYPITRFNIELKKLEQSNATDTLRIQLQNGHNVELNGSKVWGSTISIDGIQETNLLNGEIYEENVLTLEYEVISDTSKQQFTKIIECDPGKITAIELEY